MKSNRVVAFLPLLLQASCIASYVPPTTAAAPRVGTEVSASFGKTWDAVIDVFAERNIGIKTLDRSSGLVVAENGSVRPADGKAWADCGKFPSAMRGSPAEAATIASVATFNILVRGDSTRATVKATVQFSAPALKTVMNQPNGECVSLGIWEQGVEDQIKIRAQRK